MPVLKLAESASDFFEGARNILEKVLGDGRAALPELQAYSAKITESLRKNGMQADELTVYSSLAKFLVNREYPEDINSLETSLEAGDGDTGYLFTLKLDYKDCVRIIKTPEGVFIRKKNFPFAAEPTFEDIMFKLLKLKLTGMDIDAVRDYFDKNPEGVFRIGDDTVPFAKAEYFKIEVTDDEMYAFLILTGHPDEGVTLMDVYYVLFEAGINKGLSEETIGKFVYETDLGKSYLVAQGLRAVEGRDAETRCHFNTSRKLTPKRLDDGSVDHHDLTNIENVIEGQLLAERIPRSSGVTGKTVRGRIIEVTGGRDIPAPRPGKNVRLSEDGNKLYAECPGYVYLSSDGKIYVNPEYTVSGDMNYSVGNINFIGKVSVTGSVQNGFKIAAGEDIVVYGIVESAELLSSKGSIIVHRGVEGHGKARIEAAGDVRVQFSNEAVIKSSSNVVVRDYIMRSDVFAGSKVIVESEGGSIVGGKTVAVEGIEVVNAGSEAYTATSLKLYNPRLKEIFSEILEVQNKIREYGENISQLENIIKVIKLLGDKIRTLSPEKKKQLAENSRLYFALKEELKELMDKKVSLEEEGKNKECKYEGEIKVSGVVYPNVKIAIGNASLEIDSEKKSVRFQKVGRTIRVKSLA